MVLLLLSLLLLMLLLLLPLLMLLLPLMSLLLLVVVRRYCVMFGSTEEVKRLVMGNTPQAMALSNVMQPVSGKLVGYNRNPGLMREYGRGWGERCWHLFQLFDGQVMG